MSSLAVAPVLARPAVRQPMTMITTFQSGHGWSMTGSSASSNLNDTADFVIGSQAAKFVTVNNGPTNANLDSPTLTSADLTGCHVWILIKLENMAALNSLRLLCGDSTFTNFRNFNLNATETNTAAQVIREGEWTWVSVSFADASTTGTGARTAVTKWRVQAQSVNGQSMTVHVGAIGYAKTPTTNFPNGVVSVCFDDARATPLVNGALAKMMSYGYRASLFPIIDRISSVDATNVVPGQYLSLSQLKNISTYYGAEIGCHSYTAADHDAGFNTLTAAQVLSNLYLNRQYLWANNLGEGQGFAWPQGASSPTVEDAARQIVAYARGNETAMVETFPPANHYRLRSYLNTTVLATMEGLVDKAFNEQAWCCFTFHEVTATGAEQLSVSTAIFNSLIDYINTKGCAVLPIGEVLAKAAV